MHETDTSVPEPSNDSETGTDDADLDGFEADLDTVDATLEALDADDLDKAESLVASLRGMGIDTRGILLRDSGRLGLYFLEAGANQRPSRVIYDRGGAAVSLAAPEEYDFAAALDGVTRLHVLSATQIAS